MKPKFTLILPSLVLYLLFGFSVYWNIDPAISGFWKSLVTASVPLLIYFWIVFFIIKPWKRMKSFRKALFIFVIIGISLIASLILSKLSNAIILATFGQECEIVYLNLISFPFYTGYLLLSSTITLIISSLLMLPFNFSKKVTLGKSIKHLLINPFEIFGVFLFVFNLIDLFFKGFNNPEQAFHMLSWLLLLLPFYSFSICYLKQAASKRLIDIIVGGTSFLSIMGIIIESVRFFWSILPPLHPNLLVISLSCFLTSWNISAGGTLSQYIFGSFRKPVKLRKSVKNPLLIITIVLTIAWMITTLYCTHAHIKQIVEEIIWISFKPT